MKSPHIISVRYIVKNTNEAIEFYTKQLGFKVEMHPAPGFAALTKSNLQLFLNQPGVGGAGQATPDGSIPQPGGWNRFQIQTDDLDADVERLKAHGVSFKSEIITAAGGRQVLVEDPSGNLIELFEPGQR